MKVKNPLLFVTAPIKIYKNDLNQKEFQLNATATGFFYNYKEKLHFITNRHVIIDEYDGYYPDEIRLKLHTNPEKLSENKCFRIPLYNELGPVWLEHKNNDISRQVIIDIVAIPIKNDEIEPYYIESFKSYWREDFNELSFWDNIKVIGYPEGHHDTTHNLPIFPNASLASVPSVPFEGEPKFLIDAQLKPGMSGSPVLIRSMEYYGGLSNYQNEHEHLENGIVEDIRFSMSRALIGIHSGEFSIQYPPLGLHEVWFAGLISDIIRNDNKYFNELVR